MKPVTERDVMRRATEAEFGPLGVGVPRCAAIADRMLATLAREGWRLVQDSPDGGAPGTVG